MEESLGVVGAELGEVRDELAAKLPARFLFRTQLFVGAAAHDERRHEFVVVGAEPG